MDLDALQDCIAELREEQLESQEAAVCAAIEQVQVSSGPWTSLPVQAGASLDLHSAVVQHYQQRHQIAARLRTERRGRTERGRIAKRKGDDYRDKQERKRHPVARGRRRR